MTTSDSKYKLLVFGSTGAIGSATVDSALQRGWAVVAAARNPGSTHDGVTCIKVDPFAARMPRRTVLPPMGLDDAVCWAQGANLSDSVFNIDLERHWDLYKANCLFVLATLKILSGARSSGAALTALRSKFDLAEAGPSGQALLLHDQGRTRGSGIFCLDGLWRRMVIFLAAFCQESSGYSDDPESAHLGTDQQAEVSNQVQ